jgi:ADP-ribose pyrophosphatase YjhB (NUDIX family)|tara:strand:- start:6803 stop:7306 length:504 start_codon:yes stop_codon:yes gene_type:complete
MIPEGDTRLRAVCSACNTIHYSNPKVVAGTLPTWGDRVLLCRRAIEPRKGYWTLPAGYLENHESIVDGARRETQEEANAKLNELQLYTVFSLPHISQVYVFFRGPLDRPEFSSGEESLEVALFSEPDIPWDKLAFPVVTDTLEHYFRDRKEAAFPVHYAEINFPKRR